MSRVPLADIDRHLMVPPIGINRVALSLFLDVGAAWERDAKPDYHRGIGAELISEPRLGYLFGLQARAGVAKGLDATGSTEIYVRAGRSVLNRVRKRTRENGLSRPFSGSVWRAK